MSRYWNALVAAAWPSVLPLAPEAVSRVRADVVAYLPAQLARASWPIRVPVRLCLPLLAVLLSLAALVGTPGPVMLGRFERALGPASRGVVRVLRSLVYLAVYEHDATRLALGLEPAEGHIGRHRAQRDALHGASA